MKTYLETEIENCIQDIDYILHAFARHIMDDQYIDGTVAYHLDKHGRKGWIYIDEISGPQIAGISEIALTRIAERESGYAGEFQVVLEFRNGTKYFKKHPIRDDSYKSILPYKDLISDIRQN